jgi:uncharacterized protein YndB with AHSA1/START domain
MARPTTAAPIRLSVTVAAGPERAFVAFTREMDTWWPVASHSICEDPEATVIFEEFAGGRVMERSPRGQEGHWADVVVWEPPSRLVLAWQPNPEAATATELEVLFSATANGTRIDLEHRGWEGLGADAETRRTSYARAGGWPAVLNRFVRVFE